MAAHKIDLGGVFYVITTHANIGVAPNCIIDCHGRIAIATPKFDVPAGTNIRFYVNRHTFLVTGEHQDPKGYHYVEGVDEIATKRVQAVETITHPIKCPDYVLQKQWKAKHTQNAVQKTFSPRYSDINYAAVMAYLDNNASIAQKYDIVSPRSRSGRSNPSLSDFVKLLGNGNFHYDNIRCCFCRGGFVDMVKDMAGVAGMNEEPGGKLWNG